MTTTVKFVKLETGDAALIVNSQIVGAFDPSFEDPALLGGVAERLAQALGVPLERHEVKIPEADTENWTWAETILPLLSGEASTATRPRVG